MITKVLNSISRALTRWGRDYSYDNLPPETLRALATIPFVQGALVDFSIQEYDRNPHYQLVIENLANHTIGPHTKVIGISDRVEDRHNDLVEDSYIDWMSSNCIGRTYREIRKQAAKTGLGIGVPYWDFNSSSEIGTSYKVYGANCLKSPPNSSIRDRIINGIEYDSNWEPRKFYIRDDDYELRGIGLNDVKEYNVEEVIYWSRGYRDGILWPVPECYTAFQIYPYLRRYLQAVVESEEFNASFPMAISLDPQIYSAYAREQTTSFPTGSFVYQPRMVPTLKPGMKLEGIPHSVSSKDREITMQMFAAACALTVQMPKNLALGDSSNSNMASAQVDIQPWANKISIDRFDMEPMFRKSFKDWWAIAVRRVMPEPIRKKHLLMFPHIYVYPDLFEHPDPNKRASARALDLASGAATLNRLYSNRGLNFRREIEREAKSLGLESKELIQIIISSRSKDALTVINEDITRQEELTNAS